MTFADKIRLYRKGKKWTRAQLASKVGVSVYAIKTWELGLHEPGFNARVRLAELFGADLSEMKSDAKTAVA